MTDQTDYEQILKHNLFSFATSELSHSACWAWILQNLDAPGPGEVDELKRVARRLLRCVGVAEEPTSLKVSTEYVLPRSLGRVDIHAVLDDREEVIIETKVSATPEVKQLSSYRQHQRAEGGTVHLAILTTAFDADVRDYLAPHEGWTFIDMDRIAEELLCGDEFSHPLLRDYSEWLSTEIEKRDRNKRDCLSADPDAIDKALRTREGQWHLMSCLTKGMAGQQYRGTNVGGFPWTQFGFCDARAEHDGLFYRLDFGSEGPYLSLRQYQANPSPSIEAKRARLEQLQRLWTATWDSMGGGLTPRRFRKGGRKGVKESEIGWFLLTEVPPERIIAVLPKVHQAFIGELHEQGWPVATSRSTR